MVRKNNKKQRQTRKLQHPVVALVEADKKFYGFKQGPHMSLDDYYVKFKQLVANAERCRTIVLNRILAEIATDPANPTDEEMAKLNETFKERYSAVLFLYNSDRTKHGKLIRDLENDYVFGRDSYPKTLMDAYRYMVDYK